MDSMPPRGGHVADADPPPAPPGDDAITGAAAPVGGGAVVMQIGEVAERTGLSLRTIRWYGEMDVAPPSARTKGGFRLYTESDIDRFLMIKRMKPLEFTLDEMKDLLAAVDGLADTDAARSHEASERLAMYEELIATRIDKLRETLQTAESFAAELAEARQVRRPRR